MGAAVTRPMPNAGQRIRLLGGFSVEVDEQVVELPSQAQRVVGFLALSRDRLKRDQLAGRLWPFSPQHRADANLRTALWRIGASAPQLVEAGRSSVVLAPDVEVDARQVTAIGRSVLDASDPAVVTSFPAAMWQSDLLPGWDEDWLMIERERMRQLRIHALEQFSRACISQRRFPEAIDAALSAISAEPLRESAHAVLIEAHVAEGNICEAVRALEVYRELLLGELGLSPSPALVDLVPRAVRDL